MWRWPAAFSAPSTAALLIASDVEEDRDLIVEWVGGPNRRTPGQRLVSPPAQIGACRECPHLNAGASTYFFGSN